MTPFLLGGSEDGLADGEGQEEEGDPGLDRGAGLCGGLEAGEDCQPEEVQ